MEAPASVVVRERAVDEHVHSAGIVGEQRVDQAARDLLSAVLRLDDDGGELSGAVRVGSNLRYADDVSFVLGHHEMRPLQRPGG